MPGGEAAIVVEKGEEDEEGVGGRRGLQLQQDEDAVRGKMQAQAGVKKNGNKKNAKFLALLDRLPPIKHGETTVAFRIDANYDSIDLRMAVV